MSEERERERERESPGGSLFTISIIGTDDGLTEIESISTYLWMWFGSDSCLFCPFFSIRTG